MPHKAKAVAKASAKPTTRPAVTHREPAVIDETVPPFHELTEAEKIDRDPAPHAPLQETQTQDLKDAPEPPKAAKAGDVLGFLEQAPEGFKVEHEGPNRWKAQQGQNAFGSGSTAEEAINDLRFGKETEVNRGARAFAKLTPAQQASIRKRDELAANPEDATERARADAIAAEKKGAR